MLQTEIDILERSPLLRRQPAPVVPLPVPAKAKRRKRREAWKPEAPVPGFDGGFALGEREVENPYNPGQKIKVPANVRHDPLLKMLNRNEIEDWQFKAGEKLRSLIERCGGRGAGAGDWTRPYVDKSISFREPSLDQAPAAKELARAHALLGWQNYRLVHGVIFDGLNGSIIAQARGAIHDRKAIKFAVREALQQLAIMWGLVSTAAHANRRASMVAWIEEIATWTHDVSAVDIAYAEKGKRR